MMSSNQIDILLATYNGARYLSDQLDSILKQSCDNWRIFIRDDGSEDGTSALLEKYKEQYSQKIFILGDGKQNLGACGNFSELLKMSNSDYIMFCDQDDIWIRDKINITFNKMKQIENTYGSQSPILVHTDLMVVDDNLERIADSFWEFTHLDPTGRKKISRFLIQNYVTGCTMMINRALKNLSPAIPDDAVSHDWWLALVACAFGKIESIPIPTVLYRQHQGNVFGAKKWNHFSFLRNFIRALIHNNMLVAIDAEKHQTKRLFNQAQSFYNAYSEELDRQQSLLLSNFSNLETYNFIERRIKLIKYGFIKPGFARNIKLFFYV